MDSDLKSSDSSSLSSTTSKLIVLFQRLINDIWTSPINLLLVILILCLLVKLFLLKRKPSNNSSQKQIPKQLPKMPKCDLTIQELRGYNGIESNGRILTAIYGDIFDVSRRSDLYGIGTLRNTNSITIYQEISPCHQGGSYSLFAGRDATRALSKMQLDPSLFSNEYDELVDLTDKERATARNWHEDFREKYDIVGRLLKPGEKPSVYPPEDTTDDAGYNIDNKKRE